jgi:hypothetical protein
MTEPQVILEALTAQAAEAIGGRVVVVDRFPFRVGRWPRRWAGRALYLGLLKRLRLPIGRARNDLFLREPELVCFVSRHHFELDRQPEGTYSLTDRGSTCGTLVNGRLVGGRGQPESCMLGCGDEIVVGDPGSGLSFRFLVGARGVQRVQGVRVLEPQQGHPQ